MFTVSLELGRGSYSGLEAIDRARAWGLADAVNLMAADRSHDGYHEPKVTVGEAFARAWFAPQQTSASAVVPHDLLARGDVVLLPNGYSFSLAKLSAERIAELYIAVRFRAARWECERLQAELDEAKQEAETADAE